MASKKRSIREAEKSTPPASGSSADFPDFSKKLVCINYPGIVINTDKMFETLGGIQTVEHIVAHPRRNMELRFRPDDLFCKPCISDRSTKPNILLKVKVRKPITSNGAEGSAVDCKPEVVSYEVIGVSAVTFNFNKLCDFQYLPLATKSDVETADSTLEYIHDIIVPKVLPDSKWFEEADTQSLRLFHPPAYFSKSEFTVSNLHFDRSNFYEGRFRTHFVERFRSKEIERKVAQSKPDSSKMRNVILSRIDDDIPMEPNETIVNNFQTRVTVVNGLNESLNKMKKFFADRPISSRVCLHYHLQMSNDHYKVLLPCVAFYYLNGPWRMMWVRYGFDPRKDGNARIYQSLDFRIRSIVGLKKFINIKRKFPRKTDALVPSPYHSSVSEPSTSAQSLLQTLNQSALQKLQVDKSVINEDTFMLRPGLIPSCRQLMYQYCDVQLPDIQVMLSRLPSILPGTKCDPKNGWLPPGFNAQCREIVTKYIDGEINRMMEKNRAKATAASAPDKVEGGRVVKDGILLHEISSDDSSSSEDLSDEGTFEKLVYLLK